MNTERTQSLRFRLRSFRLGGWKTLYSPTRCSQYSPKENTGCSLPWLHKKADKNIKTDILIKFTE